MASSQGANDIEVHIGRIADPNVALETKRNAAVQLRDILDNLRDPDSVRSLAYVPPAVLDLLRSTQPSFAKNAIEFHLRRDLIDILHRLPISEPVRNNFSAIFESMLFVLRHDNEENGILASKVMLDLGRHYKLLTPENMAEFNAIFKELVQNYEPLVLEQLSESSPALDPNSVPNASKSFKVLGEIGLVLVIFSQVNRPNITPIMQESIRLALQVVQFEPPLQKQAREDKEAMGGLWSGMAPSIQNATAYQESLNAQIKLISFAIFVLRWDPRQFEAHGDMLVATALRLLQDTPAHGVSLRKELTVVFRHLINTEHRRVLIQHIDKFIDEDVLLGTSLTSRETLMLQVYGTIADLLTHLRQDGFPNITIPQFTRMIRIYTNLLQNPTLQTSLHVLFSKTLASFVEPIVIRDNKQGAISLIHSIAESFVERLDALAAVIQALAGHVNSKDSGENTSDPSRIIYLVEKSRPMRRAHYAIEKREDILSECRIVFRALLSGFRACLLGLKKIETYLLDATLVDRLFRSSIVCVSFYDADPRSPEVQTDLSEYLANTLAELHPHIFQQVWTQNIEFFFERAIKKITLLTLIQALVTREHTASTLVAIILNFLVDRLPLLGEQEDLVAATSIRFYKLAFGAVGHSPLVEKVLAKHLGKLLMDCFPLAAKATHPSHYFHLLRALFRAIGGGGGRFEQLYKEVLPLLPDMLENLNRHLHAPDSSTREMVVELCLTVPLRLTHLLPHLSYLMRPLALALRGSPELVAQGLRTLELCIDNLTPDFLDPTLNIVLRDLMEALHSHLKPLPAPHMVAHNTMRILGKMGGRNRKLLYKPVSLKYKHHSKEAAFPISFGGVVQPLKLEPLTDLATRTLRKPFLVDKPPVERTYAYELLEASLTSLLHNGVETQNEIHTLTNALNGLYDALFYPDIQAKVETFAMRFMKDLLTTAVPTQQQSSRELPLPPVHPFLSALIESIPHLLKREQKQELDKAITILAAMVNMVVSLIGQGSVLPQRIMPILHHLTNRILTMCYEDDWTSKNAGCAAIRLMIDTPQVGITWVGEREIDLLRALLHVLKDLPHDNPRDSSTVVDSLLTVLKIGNTGERRIPDQRKFQDKLKGLVGFFFSELQSASPVVRDAAQKCIDCIVSMDGRSVTEILLPHRDRIMSGIFTKPLRALPFPIQIGMIESVRYCVALEPPLIELNDELLRMLHECLALADADDSQLVPRSNPRQGSLEVNKLRVACIKLLTAAMPMTDFFSRHPQTRQRVTGVYFKSLYSMSQDVKDVAYDGLKMVLAHQSRLPRELLQTGLRPILMNLADPKRLSIPGLEGLAILLELLTNYFKVEIGHKLLDHFRVVADVQRLQASSKDLISENEDITKLVRLANIFHLLPSAANIFLEQLVNLIVQTEAQLQACGPSPFSPPLAKYLDRYHGEGADFFLKHLHFPRHLRTLRNILQARLAPKLEAELIARTPTIISEHLLGGESGHVHAALCLFVDLSNLDDTWLTTHPNTIDALLQVWRSQPASLDPQTIASPDVMQRNAMLMTIFKNALLQAPRIDLLFDLVAAYRRQVGLDTVQLTHFLYKHVACNEDVVFRRNVLLRFVTWFSQEDVPWEDKSNFVRHVVTPILVVEADLGQTDSHLVNEDFAGHLHRVIWHPLAESTVFPAVEEGLICELLHLTTIMVQHYSSVLDAYRKDIIRCTSNFEASEDAIVKQTAFLLSAHFFVHFKVPVKFKLRTWAGLLKLSPLDGRPQLRQEALSVLAPSLASDNDPNDSTQPQWSLIAQRMLTDENNHQTVTMYQLIVKEPTLFYPVRAMFIPHLAGSLNKLGLSPGSSNDTRLLSVDILEVIFNWEETAQADIQGGNTDVYRAPLLLRENMLSYLVRLASIYQDPPTKPPIVPRILGLLKRMAGPNGWRDVAFGLRFFGRALEQNDLSVEGNIPLAISTARVLQVIATDQDDDWYREHADVLSRLIQKGLASEEPTLVESLHDIFDRLSRLYPLPKEDEEQTTELAHFHTFVYSTIGENLRNGVSLRGAVLMLKSVVMVNPERIEPFTNPLIRVFNKLAKDHIANPPTQPAFDALSKLLITMLEICQVSIPFLAEARRTVLSVLVVLVEKSRSLPLCRYLLDLARTWAFRKQDPYPTMKEKAGFLHKMASFETRGEALFNSYLELIYDIYVEPSLRRSDLTSRLEHSFLLGCRARDTAIRERFLELLDASVPRSLINRLVYVLAVQSWDALAEHNWIYLASHLLMGAIDLDLPPNAEKRGLTYELSRPTTSAFIRPIQRLLFGDSQAAHHCWVSLFSSAWSCLSRREQGDVSQHMINLLAKDFHVRQADARPNVVQTLLDGIYAANPPMTLPAHLVKYLAKTFNAWHVGLELLNTSLDYLHVHRDDENVRDTLHDSLADLYGELSEEDAFYGLWRRRSLHPETNQALALEQNGMWQEASAVYESAQNKARNSAIPFTESEYCLWEDHWVLAASKLQHWDLLYDLAKSDNNHELMLECAWRIKEWASSSEQEALEEQISLLPDVPTPRRRIFETFLTLLKLPNSPEKGTEFTKNLEDAIQLSLRKWAGLPHDLSSAHIPLLQHFQQFVELQEAVAVFGSLAQTNAQNLEKKSSELKVVLQAWRERLPDIYDDINVWSDLVAWRQNVFHAINQTYLPLIPPAGQNGAGANNSNTFGYRGYHETAWIINRFAHTARKHNLLDVCHTQLTRIYQLPNIEISEAFLKLREQARCHYQRKEELQAGLEVINNTNLMYFSPPQKSEFYTLKGALASRLDRKDEANNAFGQAVQMDLHNAKAWAEWGKHNDRLFKDIPTELSLAANAVSCYLQAAGEFKNSKSRPLLARVLWLLGLDDQTLAISRAFDQHKGDAAYWYWITLVPQLCQSISHREARQARYILVNLAKHFPQALFYHLRTTREELLAAKRHAEDRARLLEAQRARQAANSGDVVMKDGTESATANAAPSVPPEAANTAQPSNPGIPPNSPQRVSTDALEDVVQALKTSFPLLILSMETMVDQFISKVSPKSPPIEEELYRNLYLVLQDACQTYTVRMAEMDEHMPLGSPTLNVLNRFLSSEPVKNTPEVARDFQGGANMSLLDYIRRLQKWRDEYEKRLDSRPQYQSLDSLSHYLTHFQYSKVDEIEVPGQYTEEKDSNQNFVRIRKFGQRFENCRSNGMSWKRVTIHGSDYSKTYFSVQSPIRGHPRREEKSIQLFRSFNLPLASKKESRKRNLHFHLPAVVCFSTQLRLYQSDPSSFTLGDVYDLHCEEQGMGREDPLLASGDKVKKVMRELKKEKARNATKHEYLDLKRQIMEEISLKMVPDDILLRFMMRTTDGPYHLWRMRKQFALQLASASFMTFVICLSSRHPHRFTVSRSTGQITMTEILPGLAQGTPIHQTTDIVPFRYTPNMQKFVGTIFTEGIMTTSMMSIGRCLTDPEFDLESQLSLFCRDEVLWWMQSRGRSLAADSSLRQLVQLSADAIVKRAEVMACKTEREQLGESYQMAQPVVQSVMSLISSATDPLKIIKLGEIYFPWF